MFAPPPRPAPPSPARPVGRLGLLIGALVLSATCAEPETPGEAPDASTDAPPAASVEGAGAAQAEPDEPSVPERLAGLRDFRSASSSRSSAGFRHDPHAEIGCATCHTDPPGHGTHRRVACDECHGAPTGVDRAATPTPDDCMGCHHERTAERTCTSCHDPPAQLPSAVVEASIDVAGAQEDRLRELAFRHDLHGAPACTECHRGGDTFSVDRGCASCHERHHRPDADCLACHAPLPLSTHDLDVHGGCSGTACHDDPLVLGLPASRPVCLSCHQGLTDHEPGQECSACHQVGGAP